GSTTTSRSSAIIARWSSTRASVTSSTPKSAISTSIGSTARRRCAAGGSHSRAILRTRWSATAWRRWRMGPGRRTRGWTALPLAYGDLDEADARELQALKKQVEEDSGLRCDGYKEKCLRRRIAVRMRARGVHRYADYAALLRSDPSRSEEHTSELQSRE